jgi:ribosome biogenesis ATPase
MQAQWNSLRKININNSAVLEQPNTAHETPIEAAQADQSPPVPDSEPPASRKRKPPSMREEGPQKRLKSSVHPKSTEPSSLKKDYSPPTTRLSDLGGVQPCVEKMLELVAMPLRHPEVYTHTGVQPPRGVLLHGPPGCGKTLLANAIAGVSKYSTL